MLYVLARSASFRSHFQKVCPPDLLPRFTGEVETIRACDEAVLVIVHIASFPQDSLAAMLQPFETGRVVLGIADDAPSLAGLLNVTSHNFVCAYFNSYMADLHYEQMLGTMRQGQHWYPPALLGQALGIARSRSDEPSRPSSAQGSVDWRGELSSREQQVALDVANGLSNAQIAGARGITERTVKSHLTRIYRKLGLSGRLVLAIRIREDLGRAA
jgi:DNA-binding NarL/FixJ family response regulator